MSFISLDILKRDEKPHSTFSCSSFSSSMAFSSVLGSVIGTVSSVSKRGEEDNRTGKGNKGLARRLLSPSVGGIGLNSRPLKRTAEPTDTAIAGAPASISPDKHPGLDSLTPNTTAGTVDTPLGSRYVLVQSGIKFPFKIRGLGGRNMRVLSSSLNGGSSVGKIIPTIKQAEEILGKYNKEPFHIQHAKTVGGVMGYFAKKYDPEKVDFWTVCGILHDIDFELYPKEHCVKGVELLKENNIDDSIIHATMSHGFIICQTEYKPTHFMEKMLYATDELTGLIWAYAQVRPSKDLVGAGPNSIIKKFKDKNFAAGCHRDAIRKGAEMMGWSVDNLITKTLAAMQTLPN